MIRIFIMADDLTGALDTGVAFAKRGIPTRVCTRSGKISSLLSENQNPEAALTGSHPGFPDSSFTQDDKNEVLVVNTESRHLSPEDAYQIVFSLTRAAIDAQIPIIYKKTDSALRGNVGSELAAALSAAGALSLHFLPAAPSMNRLVKDGRLFINGVPVSESAFGKDPLNPVRTSDITQLIHEQCTVPVSLRTASGQTEPSAVADKPTNPAGPSPVTGRSGSSIRILPSITLYDAASEEELRESFSSISRQAGSPLLLAGCFALADLLAEVLFGKEKAAPDAAPKTGPFQPLFILCGSIHPVSTAQTDTALLHGIPVIHLKEKISRGDISKDIRPVDSQDLSHMLHLLKDRQALIVDFGPRETTSHIRSEYITELMAGTALSLLTAGYDGPLMIIGGDTLQAFLDQAGVDTLCPLCEADKGTVVSQVPLAGKIRYLLTKSGGFGEPDLLLNLASLRKPGIQ